MKTSKLIGSTVVAFAVVLAMSAGSVLAQGHEHKEGAKGHAEKSMAGSMGHSHDRASIHDGSVTMTDKHHFEVVFHEKELRVYVYTIKQDPITNLKGLSASAFLKSKGGDTLTLKLSYVAPDSAMKSTQGYLSAKHDFSAVKNGTMKASFSIDGLDNPKETSVTFRESVKVHDEEGMHGDHMKKGHDDDHDGGHDDDNDKDHDGGHDDDHDHGSH